MLSGEELLHCMQISTELGSIRLATPRARQELWAVAHLKVCIIKQCSSVIGLFNSCIGIDHHSIGWWEWRKKRMWLVWIFQCRGILRVHRLSVSTNTNVGIGRQYIIVTLYWQFWSVIIGGGAVSSVGHPPSEWARTIHLLSCIL
jgi:hypothetical protein